MSPRQWQNAQSVPIQVLVSSSPLTPSAAVTPALNRVESNASALNRACMKGMTKHLGLSTSACWTGHGESQVQLVGAQRASCLACSPSWRDFCTQAGAGLAEQLSRAGEGLVAAADKGELPARQLHPVSARTRRRSRAVRENAQRMRRACRTRQQEEL